MNVDMSYLNSLIFKKQVQLENAKTSQDRREKLMRAKTELEYLYDTSRKYLQALEIILAIINSESQEYKRRRNSYLNSVATEEIAKIFPEDNFTAQIKSKIFRGVPRTELRLYREGDPEGYVRIPKVSEGLCFQYLLSFACVTGTVASLGKNVVYIDEAFGSADNENLSTIGNILKEKVDAGFQILLISQREALYENIPRREIKLYRDVKLNKVMIKEVVDYD